MIKQRIAKLTGEKFLIQKKMDACGRINEFQKLKEKLEQTDKALNALTSGSNNNALKNVVLARIDDLEARKEEAIQEKGKCTSIIKYRKLIESIKLLDRAIDANIGMLASIK